MHKYVVCAPGSLRLQAPRGPLAAPWLLSQPRAAFGKGSGSLCAPGARPQLTAPLPGRVQVAQLRELLQQRLLHEVQGEVLPAQGSVLPAVPARHRGAARHPRVPR